MNKRPATERLVERIGNQPPDQCWEYPSTYATRSGHKMIWGNGGMRGVHRVAWEAWNGTIPAGMWVLHHCDNPPCCNPAHLYLGTPADNNRDRDERGRHRALRGSQNGQAKLTEDDALEIRERYAAGGVSQYALAAEYGVHQSAVWHVINGTGWRHAHAEAQA